MKSDEHGFGDRISLVMALRKQGIRSIDVLSAMELVPRELFLLPAFANQAYYDMALPIDCGQTISQPFVVAHMTEQLAVGKTDKVLEIGTGSGYQAAVLSHLARRVFTVELRKELQLQADQRFRHLGLDNIHSRCGDGAEGWPEQAPFERIIVTAAAKLVPPALLGQLALGGRLVMPVGDTRETQFVTVIDRTDRGLDEESGIPVRFVPLQDPDSAGKF